MASATTKRGTVVPELLEGYKEWITQPERARSLELDFGVHWRLPPGIPLAHHWRVSWIERTGELYARELDPEGDRYIFLGQHATREEVEEAMAGWATLGPKSVAEWFGVPIGEGRRVHPGHARRGQVAPQCAPEAQGGAFGAR